MKRQPIFLLIAVIFFTLLESCSTSPNSHTYIERLGTDTISVETFSRSNNSYEGKLLIRMPATQIATFKTKLNQTGLVSIMNIEWRTPSSNPGGPKPRAYSVAIKDDTTATVHMTGVWRGKDIDTTYQMSVPNGAVPGFGKEPPALATFSQIIHQANLKNNNSSYSTNILIPGSNRQIKTTLTHLGGDTLSLRMFGYSYLATVNSNNNISWYSAQKTTVKTVTKSASNVNLEQVASRFARLDAEGRGMPIASPLDSAMATLDGAHLKIIYSRPSMRGRKIWGSLVPYDTVWRTGANAATQFSTDKDLMVGNTKVPAGTYTLYSIYTPDSGKLIINSQTGQWGTVYNESRDFARIPMEKSNTDLHEEFAISIDTTGGKGYIRLAWDTTQYQVPFKVINN
ncbi:MAG TPA: DUF2911 domain-containing protein [Balneolales bacterium]|nr:DUF2911 domain-containing protein [Balneolales bacterium]